LHQRLRIVFFKSEIWRSIPHSYLVFTLASQHPIQLRTILGYTELQVALLRMAAMTMTA